MKRREFLLSSLGLVLVKPVSTDRDIVKELTDYFAAVAPVYQSSSEEIKGQFLQGLNSIAEKYKHEPQLVGLTNSISESLVRFYGGVK